MEQKIFHESGHGVKLTPIGFRDAAVSKNPTVGGAQMLEEVVVVSGFRSFDSDSDCTETLTPSFDEINATRLYLWVFILNQQ